MAVEDKWFVDVVDYDAEENTPPVKRLGPMDERTAEKTERGLNMQINHDQYFTRMVIAPNVQIEGQPASGLSRSNAGLCVKTTE